MNLKNSEHRADLGERSGLAKAAAVGTLAMGLLAGLPALAAGGHHAVDDAAIAEPGTCKVESWLSSEDKGEKLTHAGAGCRLGPIEATVSATYARLHEGGSATGYGLQGKWAVPIADGISAGLLVASAWQAHEHPAWTGGTVAGLLTWAPRDDLALHLNVGRDYVHRVENTDHSGVALEWSATPQCSFVAERFAQSQTRYLRAGARWAVTKSWSLDFSRAHRLSGRLDSIWTVGATWQFERK